MLHEFLEIHRVEVLALAEEKTKNLAGLLEGSPQLRLGLPLFYEQLIWVLNHKLNEKPNDDLVADASSQGGEYLRLGFSLSHVVHAYGAMCQAITELATIKNANISSKEFNILNGCLDVAIAAAVSEFQFRNSAAVDERETKHLGFLAHELRNSLSSATVAHEMIKAGVVGTGGSTAKVLELNLDRMRYLIDRSLAEVRLRADVDLFVEKFRLSDLLNELLMTARVDAAKRKIEIISDIDATIEMETDRHIMLSAVANLVQNAIKYTKSNSKIWLRSSIKDDQVRIEVEDECGGIDVSKVSSLFEPFTQDHKNKSGLGLGLSIARRAVEQSQGKISVTNHPSKGCSFVIDIPNKFVPGPSSKVTVPGIDSVQPNYYQGK